MSRPAMPYIAADISALARSLKEQWDGKDGAPGHVELLNMLARGVGFRNFQHFRAQREALDRIGTPAPPPEPVDMNRVKALLRYFDAEGRLARWPSRLGLRQTCLWVPWSRLPGRRILSEPEVNRFLTDAHTFGDYALLRRWMCDYGMLTRTADGREYRRVEQAPPAEARMLIHCVHRAAARTKGEADDAGP